MIFTVRLGDPDDAISVRNYLEQNQVAHASYAPVPAPDWLDLDVLRARFVPDPSERKVPFLAVANDDAGTVLGMCTLSNVVRGAFQSAHLGYQVDHRHYRQGIGSRMVAHVLSEAFGTMGLHRVEASTLLDNVASQAVLARAHFREIGVSTRHLNIAGRWQDHRVHALTVEDWSGPDAV